MINCTFCDQAKARVGFACASQDGSGEKRKEYLSLAAAAQQRNCEKQRKAIVGLRSQGARDEH